MLRYFENLLDPYQRYDEDAELPNKLLPFMKQLLWPARWIIAGGMVLGLISALTEALLIAFASQLIDILATAEPENLWEDHGTTLLLMILVALIIRPLADIAWSILMGQGFYPPSGALIPLAHAP